MAQTAFDIYLKQLKYCKPLSRKEEQRKFSNLVQYRKTLYQNIDRQFIDHHFPEFEKKEEEAKTENPEDDNLNRWHLLEKIAPLYFVYLHFSALKENPDSKKYKQLEAKKSKVFSAYLLWQVAKDEVINPNLRLGLSLARKYSKGKMPLEDAVIVANQALMRAANSFDYTRGFKFSTYANWWVRQAVQRGSLEHAAICLPVHLHAGRNKALAIKGKMEQKQGSYTLEEIAIVMERKPEEVENLLNISTETVSLDASYDADEGGQSSHNSTEDPNSPDPEAETDQQQLRQYVSQVLPKYLNPRELDIIRSRLLSSMGEKETLRTLGQRHSLTRERMRQIQNKALHKLSEAPEFQRMYKALFR